MINNTSIGLAVRALDAKRYVSEAWRDFTGRFPPLVRVPDNNQQVSLPEELSHVIAAYVHALKTIKRDFAGIPMFVAYQPYMARLDDRGFAGFSTDTMEDYLRLYPLFIEETRNALAGYLDDDWTFFDVHGWYGQTMLGTRPPGDGVHLDDELQVIVGEEVARRLVPLVCGARR